MVEWRTWPLYDNGTMLVFTEYLFKISLLVKHRYGRLLMIMPKAEMGRAVVEI